MNLPRVCRCHHSRVVYESDDAERPPVRTRVPHYHTPGGVMNKEMAGYGLEAFPFRPGKTRKSNNRRAYRG